MSKKDNKSYEDESTEEPASEDESGPASAEATPEVQEAEVPVPLGGNEPGVCPPSVVGTSHEPKPETPPLDGDEAPGT